MQSEDTVKQISNTSRFSFAFHFNSGRKRVLQRTFVLLVSKTCILKNDFRKIKQLKNAEMTRETVLTSGHCVFRITCRLQTLRNSIIL